MATPKPKTVQLSKHAQVVMEVTEYKSKEVVSLCKMYLEAHGQTWERARGGFNVPVEAWPRFVKAVNAVKL